LELKKESYFDLLKSLRERLSKLGQTWECREIEGNEKKIANTEHHSATLDFYELLKMNKPKQLKEVEEQIKIILKKVDSKMDKTKVKRSKKKEKIIKKKDEGLFIPKKEFETKKEEKVAKKKDAKQEKKNLLQKVKQAKAEVIKKAHSKEEVPVPKSIKKLTEEKQKLHPSWAAKKALFENECSVKPQKNKVIKIN